MPATACSHACCSATLAAGKASSIAVSAWMTCWSAKDAGGERAQRGAVCSSRSASNSSPRSRFMVALVAAAAPAPAPTGTEHAVPGGLSLRLWSRGSCCSSCCCSCKPKAQAAAAGGLAPVMAPAPCTSSIRARRRSRRGASPPRRPRNADGGRSMEMDVAGGPSPEDGGRVPVLAGLMGPRARPTGTSRAPRPARVGSCLCSVVVVWVWVVDRGQCRVDHWTRTCSEKNNCWTSSASTSVSPACPPCIDPLIETPGGQPIGVVFFSHVQVDSTQSSIGRDRNRKGPSAQSRRAQNSGRRRHPSRRRCCVQCRSRSRPPPHESLKTKDSNPSFPRPIKRSPPCTHNHRTRGRPLRIPTKARPTQCGSAGAAPRRRKRRGPRPPPHRPNVEVRCAHSGLDKKHSIDPSSYVISKSQSHHHIITGAGSSKKEAERPLEVTFLHLDLGIGTCSSCLRLPPPPPPLSARSNNSSIYTYGRSMINATTQHRQAAPSSWW